MELIFKTFDALCIGIDIRRAQILSLKCINEADFQKCLP